MPEIVCLSNESALGPESTKGCMQHNAVSWDEAEGVNGDVVSRSRTKCRRGDRVLEQREKGQ